MAALARELDFEPEAPATVGVTAERRRVCTGLKWNYLDCYVVAVNQLQDLANLGSHQR